MEKRLRKFLSVHKGCSFKAKDWEIENTDLFSTKSEVYKREVEIKKWKSRKRIQDLIKNHKG